MAKSAARLFVPAWLRPLLKDLKGAPLAVFLCYASHADKDGLAWPSVRLLQRETGYGKNSVKAARKKLLTLGLLATNGQDRPVAGKWGRKPFTVALKQAPGTVALSTVAPSAVAPSTVAPYQGHEGISIQKGNHSEGERSQKSDAGLRSASLPATEKGQGKLQKRLAAKIAAEGERLADYLDRWRKDGEPYPGWWPDLMAGCQGLRYQLKERSELVHAGFTSAIYSVWEDYADAGLPASTLCSKVMDLCHRDGVPWPPDFQEHRDRLRQQERQQEEGKE